MKTKMLYYVIFTIQVYGGKKNFRPTNQFRPAIVKRPLFWPSDVETEDDYTSRKYCGILNFKQLIQFLCEVYFESTCDTLGSLTEYGWWDAISFEKTDEDYWNGLSAYLNAYVSPMFEEEFIKGMDNKTPDNYKLVKHHLGHVLDWLKNDAIEDAYEIKQEKKYIPWLDEYYFDFTQLILPNF